MYTCTHLAQLLMLQEQQQLVVVVAVVVMVVVVVVSMLLLDHLWSWDGCLQWHQTQGRTSPQNCASRSLAHCVCVCMCVCVCVCARVYVRVCACNRPMCMYDCNYMCAALSACLIRRRKAVITAPNIQQGKGATYNVYI